MHRLRTYTTLLLLSGLGLAGCGDEDPPVEETSPLQITSSALPNGREDVDYQVEISASGGTGEDFRWSVADGGLPPGVFLVSEGTPSTLVSGRPRSGGVFDVTLQVTDSGGNQATADFIVEVEGAPPPVELSTPELPEAALGQSYTATLTAENGSDYAWRIVAGSLPDGLSLSEPGTPNAFIRGIPTEEGEFSFTLRVRDAAGTTDEASYEIPVFDRRPPLSVVRENLPIARVEVPYTARIRATGGSLTGYEWTLREGELPPGVVLETSGTPSAVISGTPTQRGAFSFQVQVSDSEGNRADNSFFIEVREAPDPLRIVTFDLPSARVGEPYEAGIEAVNGSEMGYVWSALSNLPAGLTLTGGTPDATLSGTPTEAGGFEVVVRVEDDLGGLDEQSLSIDVAEAIVPVRIDDTGATNGVLRLPNAEGGQPYEVELRAFEGAPLPANAPPSAVRYNWVVTAGELPPGLNLDPIGRGPNDVGRFVGVPAALGTYTATVTVFDRMNQTDSIVIRIGVDPPSTPLEIVTTTLDDVSPSACYRGRIIAAGGGNSGYRWSLVGGSLPPGLTLAEEGTPGVEVRGAASVGAGTFTFTVEVEDGFGLTDRRQLSLTVDPAAARGEGRSERFAIYVADEEVDDRIDIFVQDLCVDPLPTPVRVNPPFSDGDVSASTSDVRVSPRGDAVAFIGDLRVDEQDDVYVVDLRDGAQGGEAVRILEAADSSREAIDLRWSPDGTKIAIRYDGTRSGADELWVADVSDLSAPASAVRVSQAGSSTLQDVYDEYAFSPDGNWISWLGDNERSAQDEIWVADLSGATPGAPQSCAGSSVTTSREVRQAGYIWTPDSRGLVFVGDLNTNGRDELYFCDLSSPPPYQPERIAGSVPSFGTIEENTAMDRRDHLAFSPDGTQMFFIGDLVSSFEFDLFVMSYDSATGTFGPRRNLTQLTASSAEVKSARWAPSGYLIAAAGDLQSSSRDEVFVFDGSPTAPEGQTLTPLKSTNGSLSLEALTFWDTFQFSPDGTKVAFLGDFDTSGANEIYVVDIRQGAPYADQKVNSPLSSSLTDVLSFAWVGEGLVYLADEVSSRNELFYSDISSGVPTPPARLHPTLGSAQDVDAFEVLADGDRVVFRGNAITNDDGAYVVDVSGATPTEPAPLTDGEIGVDRDVRLLLVR